MSLMLSAVRIRNFRSLVSADFSCTSSSGTVLIGANNAGKTAFLSAIRAVFDSRFPVSSEDIYRASGDRLSDVESRKAIIDVLILPSVASPLDGDRTSQAPVEFSPEWQTHFGRFISLDDNFNQSVSIRATIMFNRSKGEFEVERKILLDWPGDENIEEYSDYYRDVPRETFFEALPVFYLDARRDIVADMRDKFSYFAKLVKDIKIDPNSLLRFEEELQSINSQIVNESDVLQHLSEKLGMVSQTLDANASKILIHPVTQKMNDLGRNLVINFQDESSDVFPMNSHGMGTRSWVTFLTLLSYVDWQIKLRGSEDKCYHPIILLEEPEAHLHPNSQRNIYKQIKSLNGQIFVSTHSPSIVSQVDPFEILYISKKSGKAITKTLSKDITSEELRKLKFEILRSRGELLFSEMLILCEGETEEQSLPTFFKKYFDRDLYEVGINIVSVGGSGKYKPFLKLARSFDIPVFIFSDGENNTIEQVKKVVKSIFKEDNDKQMEKVVFLSNGHDFEGYLVDEGYVNELVMALEEEKGEGFLDKFVKRKHGTSSGRSATDEICSCCNQNIFKDDIRDYYVEGGDVIALNDCLRTHKTAYSSTIANYIIDLNEGNERMIPSKILELFGKIKHHYFTTEESL